MSQRASRPLHAHRPREQRAGGGVLLDPHERPADGGTHLVPGLHVLPGLDGELDEERRPGRVTGHRLGEREGVPLGRSPGSRWIAQPPRSLGQLDGGRRLESEKREVRSEAEQRRCQRGIELADLLCLVQEHRMPRLDLATGHPEPAEQDHELRVESWIVDQV